MKRISIFILTILTSNLISQKKCQGVLLDSLTLEAIEFANVGIIGKGVGTVTNEKGEFNFEVPDSLLKCPVKISMIGYKSKALSVDAFDNQKKIKLAPISNVLEEVKVTAKKSVSKIIGNQTKTESITAGFKKNNLGAEMGIKLNIKKPKTYLKTFYLNIVRNEIEKPIFRLNVYSVNEKGYPKDNLLTQNIIIEPKEKIGFIELDLKPYNIYVDDDVIISIEWIKDLGDASKLYFSTKLIGSDTYFRNASQDKWEKTSIGVGLHVEVAY